MWSAYEAGDLFIGYIILMIYTGMMPGELLDLKLSSIDLDNGQIVGAGKKTKVRKATPITVAEFVKPVLLALMTMSNGAKLVPMNRDRFYEQYHQHIVDAGVRDLPPYSCRHTTAIMAEFASNGKGNLGVTLGAIGTGLAAINNGNGSGILGGILGGGGVQYATKEGLDNAILLAQKDSEIALLKSEQEAEKKMQDVYERVMQRVNADYAAQSAINTQQAVYNSTANANMSVLNTQVAQLMGLTALRIPAESVCPQPMPKYNSWTAPTNPTTAG